MPQVLGGVHAVLYALFTSIGQIDWQAMDLQVDLCIEAGVAGIVVLGLATEVTKLTPDERAEMIGRTAARIAGRVPLGVTVSGDSLTQQRVLVELAEQHGAAWIILQAPGGNHGAESLIAFFGQVAGFTSLPVAIQNAPQLMGRGLTAEDIARLVTAYPNITHVKGEMPVLEVDRLKRVAGDLTILNGQGGLEMLDNLRAGCAGFILAPDIVDWAVAVFAAWQKGDTTSAEQLYGTMLAESVFVMKSVEHLHAYGKRIFGFRAGIAIHDRAPFVQPTRFGLELADAHAEALGRMGLRINPAVY